MGRGSRHRRAFPRQGHALATLAPPPRSERALAADGRKRCGAAGDSRSRSLRGAAGQLRGGQHAAGLCRESGGCHFLVRARKAAIVLGQNERAPRLARSVLTQGAVGTMCCPPATAANPRSVPNPAATSRSTANLARPTGLNHPSASQFTLPFDSLPTPTQIPQPPTPAARSAAPGRPGSPTSGSGPSCLWGLGRWAGRRWPRTRPAATGSGECDKRQRTAVCCSLVLLKRVLATIINTEIITTKVRVLHISFLGGTNV
jgi:hypothetical protein